MDDRHKTEVNGSMNLLLRRYMDDITPKWPDHVAYQWYELMADLEVEVLTFLVTSSWQTIADDWEDRINSASEKLWTFYLTATEYFDLDQMSNWLEPLSYTVQRVSSEQSELPVDAQNALTEASNRCQQALKGLARLVQTQAEKMADVIEEEKIARLYYHEICWLVCSLAVFIALHREKPYVERAHSLAVQAFSHAHIVESIWKLIGDICPECGEPFVRSRSDQKFCTDLHRGRWNARQSRRRAKSADRSGS